MTDFVLSDWVQVQKARTHAALSSQLSLDSAGTGSPRLLEAMRYASLNGGKRLRALLVYATGQAFNTDLAVLDKPASAVELIHAYSLVHDDMPAMDNDDLRRGSPTCHKAFDEATALLAGDALQSLAFSTLCETPVSSERQIAMVSTLANLSGLAGMAGGQAIDLESVGKTLYPDDLENMHALKTAALIQASVKLGALASDQSDKVVLDSLSDFGLTLGLAFQIQDDILDVTSDTETLGKPQGADIALNKPTYPALMGLEQAQQKAAALTEQALAILDDMPYDTSTLAALARFVIDRKH